MVTGAGRIARTVLPRLPHGGGAALQEPLSPAGSGRVGGDQVGEVAVAVIGQHLQDVLRSIGPGGQVVPLGGDIGGQAGRDRLLVPFWSQAEREAVHVGGLVVGSGGDDAVWSAQRVGVKPGRVAVLMAGGVVELVVDGRADGPG